MSDAPLTPRVFVDTDVLLASEDGAHPKLQAAALAWLRVLWERRWGRTSTQVLHDFYLAATQRLHPPMPAGDARAEVRRYEQWQPWRIDHATVESAWAIESRHGLKFNDCLVIASAQHLGCTHLLSDTLHAPKAIGGLQIVQPRSASPSLLDTL